MGFYENAFNLKDGAISVAENVFHDIKAEQKLGIDVKVAGRLKFKDFWKRVPIVSKLL